MTECQNCIPPTPNKAVVDTPCYFHWTDDDWLEWKMAQQILGRLAQDRNAIE